MKTSTGELIEKIESLKSQAKLTIEEISQEEPRMRKIRFALRRKLDGKIEAYNEFLKLLKNENQ